MKKLLHFILGIRADERGSTVTFIAAAAIPLVAFSGLAVDTARGYLVKQRLAYAIEAAALAAAKSAVNATDAEIEATGRRYFDANFPSGALGSENVTLTYTISANKREITIKAAADVQTALMTAVGIDTMEISTEATALRESKGLELAIALDNTKSMDGYVDDLEDAAQQLLDVLYGEEETVANLWVALLPFDTRVNLANYPSIVDFTPSNINEVCANPRPSPHTTDDATPSDAPFSSQWVDPSPSWIDPGCEAEPAIGLTAEKSTLEETLEGMDDDGYTRIDVAAAWAHRMLSPGWRGLWGNADLPLDYNTPLMDKAAIIMTDGENHPRDGTSKSTANARLLEVCTAMKDDNIIVHTIQYREDDEDLQDLMRDCATSAAYYFYAEDDDLSSVFNQIANQLSNLRLLNVK